METQRSVTDPSTASFQLPAPVTWTDDGVAMRLLDQTLLPGEERYLRLETVEDVAEAIGSLRIRGAPAIGIAAAMGLAMGMRRRARVLGEGTDPSSLESGFLRDAGLLTATRPTAVNLSWAAHRMLKAFHAAVGDGVEALLLALTRESEAIAREDREMCRLIGIHGVRLIPDEGAGILTHCNAGALATGGMGTALAPVYTAWSRGTQVRLFAGETRPLLQGARITAWEAQRVGVPVTVVTDSMAGALMARGDVDLVIVGADRVAANGDVANKIGTYALAVLARHHGLPFYVALPRSTLDPELADGAGIPIEGREEGEVRWVGGRRAVPEDAAVWNPAFDVTPSHLVTAMVTDGGILRPPFGQAISDLLAPGEPVGGTADPTRRASQEEHP